MAFDKIEAAGYSVSPHRIHGSAYSISVLNLKLFNRIGFAPIG
jgi:hypothetical protein